jgi:hypothetical protein
VKINGPRGLGRQETFAPGMALQNQVRELHRLLGKKTLEAEILKTKRASKKQQPTQSRRPPS